MKRKLLMICTTILLAMTMAGCGEKNTQEPNNNVQTIKTMEEAEEVTFRSGLKIENNDMYDGSKREFKFDKLLAEMGEFKLYWDGAEDHIDNVDGDIYIPILIKNESNEAAAFSFSGYRMSGDMAEHAKSDVTLVHPNGAGNYYLEPGEDIIGEIDIALLYDITDPDLEGKFCIEVDFGVTKPRGYYKKYTFKIEENLKHLSQEAFDADEYNNATISGVITDNEGNPIVDANVQVVTSLADIKRDAVTDANGKYSITVPAAKSVISNAWREAVVEVSYMGYAQRNIPVYPKNNQTVIADITLYPQTEMLDYELVKTVDLGIQAYEHDTNGENIVFVPFHSELEQSIVDKECRATVTDFDGNVKFTYDLPQEIPYVDISKDGNYVILPIDYINGGFKIVVLNPDGTEYYATSTLEETEIALERDAGRVENTMSRCVQLSDDNKYLAVGDVNGDFWLIDMEKDEVVFSDWTMAQVRNIKFEHDNSVLYVSDGAGKIAAYDFSGKKLWKCDVVSWATEMEITEKYIICTTKCAGVNLNVIDKATGKLMWNYPTMTSSKSLAISPDEKYLWYGAHSTSAYSVIGCSIFDIETGELVYILDHENNPEGAFSADGSKIVARSRKAISVYDAKNGALLFTEKLPSEDFTGNFVSATNADMSKFVITTANPQKDGNYGVASFYKYVGVKEIDASGTDIATSGNNMDSDDNAECFRIEVKAYVDIDVSLDKHGNVLGLYDHDGKVDELGMIEARVKGKSFNEALFAILEWRGKKGNLRRIDAVEINVLKVVDTEIIHLDRNLTDAESTCKDVGQAFDATYEVRINSTDYETIAR